MEGDAWLTLWVTLVSLLLMANDCAPDLVLLGTTTFLLLCKIIGQEEAWEGFSSDSILAIGALFVLARALEETRAAERLLRPFLGNPKNHREALARLCFPCGGMSMVMNNTPIVAMLLTVCENWAARNGLSPHILLMPLSFSSMLGGMCTLIGTSTNLVLNAQIESDPDPPLEPFEMFTMTPVGLPTAAIGITALIFLAPIFLGKKEKMHRSTAHQSTVGAESTCIEDASGTVTKEAIEEDLSEKLNANVEVSGTFAIDVLLDDGCALLGQHPDEMVHAVLEYANVGPKEMTICERGGWFIKVHMMVRTSAGEEISVVANRRSELTFVWRRDSPEWNSLVLEAGDRLLLSIVAEVVPLLRRIPGIIAAPEMASSALTTRSQHRCYAKAVIHRESPLVGLHIEEAANRPLLTPAVVWSVSQRPHGHLTAVERTQLYERQKAAVIELREKVTASSMAVQSRSKHGGKWLPRPSWSRKTRDGEESSEPTPQNAVVERAASDETNTNTENASQATGEGGTSPSAAVATVIPTSAGGIVVSPADLTAEGSAPRGSSMPRVDSANAMAHINLETIPLDTLEHTRTTDALAISSVRETRKRMVALREDPDMCRSAADFGLAGATYTKLRAGDTLLLEMPRAYVEALRTYKRHFASVSILRSSLPSQRDFVAEARFWLSLVSLLVVLTLPALGVQNLLTISLTASFFCVSIGCISVNQAWQAVNYRVLLTIATSYGLGAALENTGVAQFLSVALTKLGGVLPAVVFLFVVFLFTSALSCIVSNAATVVLLYAVLRDADVDGLRTSQTILAMMLGASTAFATPIGYQTNLMVITPGGYQFGDFFLLGSILTFIAGVTSSLLIWAMPESVLP